MQAVAAIGASVIASLLALGQAHAAEGGYYTSPSGEECYWSRTGPTSVNAVCCEVGMTLHLTPNATCVDSTTINQFLKEIELRVAESARLISDAPAAGRRPLPNKPTPQQCDGARKACTSNTGETQARCQEIAAEANIDRIKAGLTCFGEYPALLGSLPHWTNEQGGGRHTCTLDDVTGDDPSPPARWCRTEFQQRAMVNCFIGLPGASTTNQAGFELGVDLGKITKFAVNGGRSVTVDTASGQGSDSYCSEAGTKHAAACFTANTNCLAGRPTRAVAQIEGLPGGPIPAVQEEQPAVALDRFDQLITQIDAERLGLKEGSKPRTLFRPIEPQPGEGRTQYELRIRFLANWSVYLKRHNLSADDQRRMELSFGSAQKEFQDAHQILAELYSEVAFPDPDPIHGRAKAVAAKRRLEKYVPGPRVGPFYLRMHRVEFTVRSTVATVRSNVAKEQNKKFSFMSTVWPGLQEFGLAAPMK